MPALLGERVPTDCPLCDGPCRHPFPRSPYQFPNNLPVASVVKTHPENPDPPPPARKQRKRTQRGRRTSHVPGPDRTTAVPGPEHDREQDR